MQNDKIDINKSKVKGRLIRKTLLIEYFFNGMLILLIPFILAINLSFQIRKGEPFILYFILLLLTLIISGLLFYSLFNTDKLKKVHGIQKEMNRENIKKAIEELKWTVIQHNQQFTIANPSWSFFSTSWGRQIIIIYNGQDILVNSTTFGLGGVISPFHWFPNRKLERQLIERFININKGTTQTR